MLARIAMQSDAKESCRLLSPRKAKSVRSMTSVQVAFHARMRLSSLKAASHKLSLWPSHKLQSNSEVSQISLSSHMSRCQPKFSQKASSCKMHLKTQTNQQAKHQARKLLSSWCPSSHRRLHTTRLICTMPMARCRPNKHLPMLRRHRA